MSNSRSRVGGYFALIFLLSVSIPACAADAAAFDAANKLYEQGQYAAAAAAYDKLLTAGDCPEALYFNAGNAWFKAGQIGRAIAAWRVAEQTAPRDPGLRFNLAFARKRVAGADAPAAPLWQRALRALTLNEWTALAAVALWIWFLLLALREVSPALRKTLRGYVATAGVGAIVFSGGLAGTAALRAADRAAVVIVSEAVARTGPLDEAKPLPQLRLRDGAEVAILDRKEVVVGEKKQTWFQVRDSAARTGWVKSDQLLVLPAS